jgi:four helix bundle protein
MTKYGNRNAKLEEAGVPSPARVRDFTDLQVWQLARELRQQVYALCTGFPSDERFTLTQQLRRATISVTATIAEGFERYSYQENIQFCRLARGSAYEVRDHLITATDQNYITADGQPEGSSFGRARHPNFERVYPIDPSQAESGVNGAR